MLVYNIYYIVLVYYYMTYGCSNSANLRGQKLVVFDRKLK